MTCVLRSFGISYDQMQIWEVQIDAPAALQTVYKPCVHPVRHGFVLPRTSLTTLLRAVAAETLCLPVAVAVSAIT